MSAFGSPALASLNSRQPDYLGHIQYVCLDTLIHVCFGGQRTQSSSRDLTSKSSTPSKGFLILTPSFLTNLSTGDVLHSTAKFDEDHHDGVLTSGPIRCAALSRCGKYLATSGDDKKLMVWEVSGLKLLSSRYVPLKDRFCNSQGCAEKFRRRRHALILLKMTTCSLQTNLVTYSGMIVQRSTTTL